MPRLRAMRVGRWFISAAARNILCRVSSLIRISSSWPVGTYPAVVLDTPAGLDQGDPRLGHAESL
jgi:hypothetical protein